MNSVSPPAGRPPPSGIFASLGHAWDGLVHTVVRGRNMRIHLVAAVMVGLVGSGIPLGLAEKVTLIFCVLFVFFAEILNTALEQVVDLATELLNDKARIAKDTAAAGVAVLAAGTVVVFAALLVHNWETIVQYPEQIGRQALFGLPLTACTGFLCASWRKPLWLEVIAALAAVGLWIVLARHTESWVFSALMAGLLAVAFAASRERRRINGRDGL
ncbi:MAG: diacylglycerol kinase family protein [Myxococcaceae bacterium]